jgi:hypothetical protein
MIPHDNLMFLLSTHRFCGSRQTVSPPQLSVGGILVEVKLGLMSLQSTSMTRLPGIEISFIAFNVEFQFGE